MNTGNLTPSTTVPPPSLSQAGSIAAPTTTASKPETVQDQEPLDDVATQLFGDSDEDPEKKLEPIAHSKGYTFMDDIEATKLFTGTKDPAAKVIKIAGRKDGQARAFNKAFSAYKAHHPHATEETFIKVIEAAWLKEVVVVEYNRDSAQGHNLYNKMKDLASSAESLVANTQYEFPQGESEGTDRLRADKLEELVDVLRPYQNLVGLSRANLNLKTVSDYRSAEFFVNFNRDDVKKAVDRAELKLAELKAAEEDDPEKVALPHQEEVLKGLKRLVELLQGMLTRSHEDWECKQSSPTVCGVKELFTAVIGSTDTNTEDAKLRVVRKAAVSGSNYELRLGSMLITILFVPDG